MQSQKDSHQKIPQQGLANLLTSDLKNLSTVLKPLSKTLYQAHNKLLNEVLLAEEEQIPNLIKKLLTHSLHLVQYKNLSNSIISVVSKIIICIKGVAHIQKQSQKEEKDQTMNQILYHTIDIICLINNQQKNPQSSLRVIQTTFSLIDQTLIKHFSCNLLTRIFSICFECCKVNTIVQNISISALFALTECLFGFGDANESFQILNYFLQYLFNSKKYMWIKQADLKGLVWDLIIVGVKNFRTDHILKIHNQHQTLQLLNRLYKSATTNIFGNKKDFYAIADDLNTKNNSQTIDINDFTRYFKGYTYLSMVLSLEAQRVNSHEYVPFMETIPKLNIILELQRNSRMFIFMQSVCRLLLNQYDIPLTLDKGLIFMDILSRISEELCLCNQSISVNWESNEFYLEKICHEQPKVNDGDFVRLIRSTALNLRQKFEKDEDLILCKKKSRQESARSNGSAVLPASMSNTKKWQHFIKCIIKVSRYLSSINFTNDDIEEDPTRKIILELQYWFLICPSVKAKNMVLEELLITSTLLNNKLQAVKVSQCVQIGSNILYGYYEDLDSIGLTIIMKMMAGIKSDWEEGKSFEELDEVYNLSINLFSEEKLIKNENSFSITLQALVQCANGLLADLSQPKEKSNSVNQPKRYMKMIDYVLKKITLVSTNNLELALTQWNFISAFFIALCFNKNENIKKQAIDHIGRFVEEIFKNKNESINSKKEQDIMSLYLELAKSQIKGTEIEIIAQLKEIMPRIKQQIALMDGFRIVKIFSQNSAVNKQVIGHINQLQQILIKQCLFGIVDKKYLKLILDGLQIKVSQKNEEYRLINLLWTISDHFRDLSSRDSSSLKQFIPLWETLIENVWRICQNSRESQTRQSGIHTLTQILAQTCSVLQLNFILEIIEKYYKNIVLLLLGILPETRIEDDKVSETAKVGIKNYIKMFKKLISYEPKDEEQERRIRKNLKETNLQIIEYIGKETQNKKVSSISLQLIYELESMILHFTEDKCFESFEVSVEMKELYSQIQEFIKMCESDKETGEKIDLNSHLFKKKVKPFIEKVGESLYGKAEVQVKQ